MIALLVYGLAGLAQAQPPAERVSVFGRRYDALRYLFSERGHVLVNDKRELFGRDVTQEDWSRWMVVVLGPHRLGLTVDSSFFTHFVQRGGSLLVANDNDDDYWFDTSFRLQIVGRPIPPAPPQLRLGDREQVFKVVDFAPSGSALFAGVNALAVNHPGWLPISGFPFPEDPWPIAARFHRFQTPVRGELEGGADRWALMVARDERQGRVVFCADSSVLINEMITLEDNLRFAANLVKWLENGRAGRRVLLLEDDLPANRWIDPRFATGNWPASDSEAFVELMNRLVNYIQEEDVPNALLSQLQRSFDQASLARLKLLLPMALALLLLVFWILHACGTLIKPTGIAMQAPAQAVVSPSRWEEYTALGNYREPAVLLARQFFRERNLLADSGRCPPPPRLRTGGLLSTLRARWLWIRFWHLARRPQGGPISQRALRRLLAQVAWMDQRLADPESNDPSHLAGFNRRV